MKPNVFPPAAVAGLALAATTLVLTASSAWAAVNVDSYKTALERAGFTVTVDPKPADHATLQADGTLITAAKGGASVKLELIVYDSRASLKGDWSAVNGQGPAPLTTTTDFDRKVLYWNENAVLAVSFAPPNEPGLAQVAGNVFLGRVGIGGPGITAPSTGDGGYLREGGGLGSYVLPALALGLGSLGLASAGVLAHRVRAH